MAFSERLQSLRQKAGLSQSQLAKAAGIPVKTLQNWEAGRVSPRMNVLPKLARALGAALDALLENGGAAEEKPKRKRGK